MQSDVTRNSKVIDFYVIGGSRVRYDILFTPDIPENYINIIYRYINLYMNFQEREREG